MTSPNAWPQPDSSLPISAKVWEVSERYDKGGPTVVRALFDAVVELEAALARRP